MPRSLVSTGSPFERQAGYSRAVVEGPWIFVSGTTGYDYATMKMPTDFGSQARNALATIAAVLTQAGSDMRDVVRARYFITRRSDAATLFEATGAVFGDIRPAATLIICDLLEEAMLVEIEVTALLRTD